ncbi:AAA family ATPase [Rhodopirellula sp. JC639]|uniref:AAA family ATPase n=1 Tax=Stieleria mannarensis TaxID=2755585 RepID=UPI0015FF2093|nr:MoxR family ATPase [Rhodopirellula sp. JC639]
MTDPTAGNPQPGSPAATPSAAHGTRLDGASVQASASGAPAPAPPSESTTASPGKSPRFEPVQRLYQAVSDEVAKLYVGQDELVLGTLTALFSGGHVLIESVPGLGKTLFVRTLGRALGCDFGRIQFTADLMPSDITGAPVFDMQKSEFRFRPGPVFTQLLLADEINRSPAKTHAALLEIMQEYRVTIDGTSHTVPQPFLVMATQNPLESEGTYNLPEAQLDRFMFKLKVDYPSELQEAEILKLHSKQVNLNERLENEVRTITDPETVRQLIQLCGTVNVEDALVDYINKIVRATRTWPAFHIGASPRAGLALMQCARTLAGFGGRDYAIPDDVVEVAIPALRHRVQLSAEAEIEGRDVDEELLAMIRGIEVPRD